MGDFDKKIHKNELPKSILQEFQLKMFSSNTTALQESY